MKAVKMEMKLGAEPKKTAALVLLLLLAAYLFYTNVLTSDVPEEAKSTTPAAAPAATGTAPRQVAVAPANTRKDLGPAKSGSKEFRPSLKPKKGEEANPAEVDPTLRIDVLAKLAAVKVTRVDRSLFDFGAGGLDPAKPKLPEPKIVVKAKPVPRMVGPEPPPPIPLKFYGAALPLKDGVKRVFCMQGEEVLTPAEGEVIQRRYKIVKITPANVLVEDLEYKNQQTLPIEEVSPTNG